MTPVIAPHVIDVSPATVANNAGPDPLYGIWVTSDFQIKRNKFSQVILGGVPFPAVAYERFSLFANCCNSDKVLALIFSPTKIPIGSVLAMDTGAKSFSGL